MQSSAYCNEYLTRWSLR